jgi:hypothetical protein
MKTKPLLATSLVAVGLFAAGCATRVTASGGRETTVLGGAVTVSTGSFQPTTPAAAVEADTSKLVGTGNPTGKKTTILWGLITLHDY